MGTRIDFSAYGVTPQSFVSEVPRSRRMKRSALTG
jgi:hypothetical protein